MKQVRKILPALAVLAFLCVFCTLLTAAADVVTVSTSAELSSAVSTLSDTGGTIRFADNIYTDGAVALPASNARITVDGDGYTLSLNGNLTLNGDMDFANICLYNAKGNGTTGDYISALGTPGVGSIGGEWMTIGLARSGRDVPSDYYDAVVDYVKANIDENGRLDYARSTENSRIILALTAIGKDVTDVGGYNLLGGLDSPTEGKILVDGQDISRLSGDALAAYRAATVGFVFQFYNLVPTLTVHENVKLVDEIAPNPLSATKMLEEVGLSDHLKNFPSELSGGEQQRVSIARALAKNPKILLCDEPTGALDSETGVMVLKLLLRMAREYGKTIVIVTHNQNIAKMADKVIHVKNGHIVSQEVQEHPVAADDIDW